MGGSPGRIRKVRIDNNPTPQGGKVRSLQKPQATLTRICQPGSLLVVEVDHAVEDAEDLQIAVPEAPRMYIHINDNYCLTKPVLENRLLRGVVETQKTLKTNVNYCVVSTVPSATRNVRQPQKKGLSPPLKEPVEIKYVNSVSYVVQCVSAQSVPNVHSVVHSTLVGGCLQPFWQIWVHQPQGSVNFERGLRTTIQSQTPSSQRPHDNQWLCRPPEKSLPRGICTKSSAQEGHRDGKGVDISSLLQQTIHSPKTKSEMASSVGPQCSKQIFERKNIQDGNSRDNPDFPPTRGMGNVTGF